MSPFPEAEAVTSAGQVSAGAVVSCTITSKVQVFWLPARSVAVAVTAVLPSGKTLPEARL